MGDASQVMLVVNNPSDNAGGRRYRFDPWVGKIPWRWAWQPTQVFVPGESHGQRSLMVHHPWGCKESDTTEPTEHATHRRSVFIFSSSYLLFLRISIFLPTVLIYFCLLSALYIRALCISTIPMLKSQPDNSNMPSISDPNACSVSSDCAFVFLYDL